MKKINICYFISSLANEGPTRVLLNIIRYIDKSKYNIYIYTIIKEKDSSLVTQFKLENVHLILAESQDGGFLSKIVKFKKFIDMNNIEIIHSHCPRSLIYMCLARVRARTVYTAHIYPGIQTIALYGKFKGELIKFISNFLIKKIDRPIACSESVAEEFKNGIQFYMPAVNNGIEDIGIAINDDLRKKFREKLGFSDEKCYALFIGRLSPEKSPYLLAEAFKKLSSDDYSLVIIGDGPEAEKIRNIQSTNIRLDGFQKDIFPYLCAVDIYVSPSKTEGLANSLLEAMAAGIPLLLSDIPSHRYIISRSDSHIGYFFDADRFTDFYKKIEIIKSEINSSSRMLIRSEFLKKYTAKSMADGYSKNYMEILNEK